jgi:hypothetical protein
MSLSSYALAYFDEARKDLHIERGLISIGETRFGSIYWSLNSVLDGIPAFKHVVQDRSLGIESEVGILVLRMMLILLTRKRCLSQYSMMMKPHLNLSEI